MHIGNRGDGTPIGALLIAGTTLLLGVTLLVSFSSYVAAVEQSSERVNQLIEDGENSLGDGNRGDSDESNSTRCEDASDGKRNEQGETNGKDCTESAKSAEHGSE